MKIAIIIEGNTEKAFLPFLRAFLKSHLEGKMPNIDPLLYDGRIPKEQKLKRTVENLLNTGRPSADYVIGLTDIYTGTQPPDFTNAQDAKNKMLAWVGNNPRFYPHVAQYDFEAWLIPYWDTITRLAGHNAAIPKGNPERINHDNPPAHILEALFEKASCRDSYVKPRDAARILRENDLKVSIDQCSELKALINTIILLCEGVAIP